MNASTPLGEEPTVWRPAANPWLIAVTVSLAAFATLAVIGAACLRVLII